MRAGIRIDNTALWPNCCDHVSKVMLFAAIFLLTACGADRSDSVENDLIAKLADFRLNELGSPQIQSDAIPPVYSSSDTPHKLLILPVQYANREFDRFKGEESSDEKNSAYFQSLLFAENIADPEINTLSHYYYHQSQGQYFVTGEVMRPVTVEQPSEYYGQPIQNSDGQWRNDMRPEILVEDALFEAFSQNPDFPWHDFDVWDPADFDNDGVLDEADGYIDHFVLVFAGKGQSSCQGLYNLSQKFTPNAENTLFETLSENEQECAQRIWPHRFSLTKNNGKGPEIDGVINRRGGVELKQGLWVYDYNMQSEYTAISTFIHEFGHSIGLPDIYASQTSNSTASWEMMSSTVGPVPQELSTWSRMMLGWSKPCVILPPVAGGAYTQEINLRTMNDWQGISDYENECHAAMVVLPPKIRQLRMGPLEKNHGEQAAYTGQGNDLNHYLERRFDFTDLANDEILLSVDAWFSIEADWDYLYVEISEDGENYSRLMPTDKSAADDSFSVMSSRRGHDGLGTIPGFTGRSGDLDGDGRVEVSPGCNPDAAQLNPEQRMDAEGDDPCQVSQWVNAVFDLSEFKGKKVFFRFHYFADMAAVEDGALIDNVEIAAIGYSDDFENGLDDWHVEGFSISGGSHDIEVPHFYILEYRDPFEKFSRSVNYDNNLSEPGFVFYPNSESGEMEAIDFQYRPGVLLWYYNGSYLWSQNEPSQFGSGNGFLLLVDSTPQEYALPSIPEQYYRNDEGWRYYDFDESAQAYLGKAFLDVMCFQRRRDYYPVDLGSEESNYCTTDMPAGESLSYNNRSLLYGYTISNELLPGEAREKVKSMSTLFDFLLSGEGLKYRLYDRLLRNAHSADAPFSVSDFESGLQLYHAENSEMTLFESFPFEAVRHFDDSEPSRYLNPHLPYGSAAIPAEGFSFVLDEPDKVDGGQAKVKVTLQWSEI